MWAERGKSIVQAEVEEKVREFIGQSVRPALAAELTPEYRLIEKGALDSMAMFEVIAFVEDTYGVVVDDDDLVTENFETTMAIAEMVAAKSAA